MPVKIITLLLVLLISSAAFSQDEEIAVRNIDMESIGWGYHDVDVSVKNLTDYVKFLVVETEVFFDNKEGSRNLLTSYYLIEPSIQKNVSPQIFIPGNFGTATLSFRFYDVVDTLDTPLESQIFYNKIETKTFEISESLKSYSTYPMSLPPRVDIHPMFSSDFVMLFIRLLDEGKTVDQIAELTKSDTAYVREQARLLNSERLLNLKGNEFTLRFPLIKNNEAKKAAEYSETLATNLADIIGANIPSLHRVRDSLVKAGVISADSNDFMGGGTLYHRDYPIVAALSLWYDIGNEFITGSAPLLIYDGTDICNAMIYQYMYAVEGGSELTGNQFFALWMSAERYSALWSEDEPVIICEDDFVLKKQQGKKTKWRYEHPNYPEFFLMDSSAVRPLVNSLSENTEKLMGDARTFTSDLFREAGHNTVSFGYRYWFWNMTTDKILEKLVERDLLKPHAKNYFRFDSMGKGKAQHNHDK